MRKEDSILGSGVRKCRMYTDTLCHIRTCAEVCGKKADADKVQGTAADIVKRRAARRTRKLVPVRSLQSFWWRG